MTKFRILFIRVSITLKFLYYFYMGKIRGISFIIGYLRNPDHRISARLLRAYGATIGEKTTIKRSIFLDNVYRDQNSSGDFSHLVIGDNCYIGDCVYFDLANKVVIGNNVVVSGKVSFVTHADCNRSPRLRELFPRTCEQIVVEDGVWIGFGATILNGVRIGENAVVAASALVRLNVEAHTMYGGVPALKIKSL